MHLLLMFIFLVLISFAVFVKVKENRKKMSGQGIPEEIKASPISQALTELVAIAGGIYLSLLMLTTFLGIELPSKIKIITVDIDTIALIALLLTLAQPLVEKIINKLAKR